MKLKINGLSQEKTKLYNEVADKIILKGSDEYTLNLAKGEQIKVSKKGNVIEGFYSADCEIGRCILDAFLLIKKNVDSEITEKSNFNSKGVMLDFSRGGVMSVEGVKDYLRYMSLLGFNTLMMYMEDVYEIPDHPYFGYLRGRYSKEELKEIDRFGADLGIEIIPCIQALGHMEQYNKWTESKEIRDTERVLLCGEEKTYEFIELLVKTMSECFRTRKINIGMDEAWDLGLGEYLNRNGYQDRTTIFCDHIKRVSQIMDKYGYETMIWSDMYFRLASKNNGYYDENITISPEIRKLLPEKFTLCYWDYYHTEIADYDKMIEKHRKITDKIAFAGGNWCWSGFLPDVKFTLKSTTAALKSCAKNGISDVYATTWGDDGCETNYMLSIGGLLAFSEGFYTGNIVEIDDLCELITGTKFDDFATMSDVRCLGKDPDVHNSTDLNVKKVLYSDPLLNIFEKDIINSGCYDKYVNLQERYENISHNGTVFDKYFKYVSLICNCVSLDIKNLTLIRKGYDSKDKELLKTIDFDEWERVYRELKSIHYETWNEVYKPQGFENIDGRYGSKIIRLETAKQRINDYILGLIESLPELEDERLEKISGFHTGLYNSIRTPYKSM